jgi:hypothetical protein
MQASSSPAQNCNGEALFMALSLDLCAFSRPSVHYRKMPAYRLDANQENVKKMQGPSLRPDGSIEGKAEKVCELAGLIIDLIGKYGQHKKRF